MLGVLSVAAFFTLVGGLLWALWLVVTRSVRRAKQNVVVLDARIAAAATPASRRASPAAMVLRAASRTSLGYAALLCFFALASLGDFSRHRGGELVLALACVMLAGALVVLRRAVRRPVQFVVSRDGVTLGSAGRFIAWDEVDHICVVYNQTAYTERHDLVLQLRSDPAAVRPFFTTNRNNPDEVELSLDGLSSCWQDIAAGVAAISGRPIGQTRTGALGLGDRPWAASNSRDHAACTAPGPARLVASLSARSGLGCETVGSAAVAVWLAAVCSPRAMIRSSTTWHALGRTVLGLG